MKGKSQIMSSAADASLPKPLAAPGRPADSSQMAPLTELELALDMGGDAAEKAITEALVRLEDLADRTRRAMASGVAREEYARLSQLAKACQIAKGILVEYRPGGRHDAKMPLSRIFNRF